MRPFFGRVSLVGSTVYINGTDANDYVSVYDYRVPSHADTRMLEVDANGVATFFQYNQPTGHFPPVRMIIFHGGNGNDTFVNNTSLTSAAFGEGGNDCLFGGSGHDYLYGGDGGDYVFGCAGNDYLYGDCCADYLFRNLVNSYSLWLRIHAFLCAASAFSASLR